MPNFFDGLGELASALVYIIFAAVVVIVLVVAPLSGDSDSWAYYQEVRACTELRNLIYDQSTHLRSNQRELDNRATHWQTPYNRHNELVAFYRKEIRKETRMLNHLNSYKKAFCYTDNYGLASFYWIVFTEKYLPDEYYDKLEAILDRGVPTSRYGKVFPGYRI